MKTKYKIIIAGAVGAGKTSSINAISDIKTVETEVKMSDVKYYKKGKVSTTVAFDYGEIALPSLKNKLRVYGLPGQERFSFVWEIITKGSIGFIVLVDMSNIDAVARFKEYMESFSYILKTEKKPVVYALTQMDINTPLSMVKEIKRVCNEFSDSPPVLSVDISSKEEILMLVDVLLGEVETIVNLRDNA